MDDQTSLITNLGAVAVGLAATGLAFDAQVVHHAATEIERLRAALKDMLSIQQRDGETSNDCFERVADDFHRETGVMAPGKDPGAMGSRMPAEERRERYIAWMDGKSVAARALLEDGLITTCPENAGRQPGENP